MAKYTFLIYVFSVLYAFVIPEVISANFVYYSGSYPIPGCQIASDEFLTFVECDGIYPSYIEFVLSIPLYLVVMSFVVPAFFVYGFTQLFTNGSDHEPLITLILFPITLLIIFLGTLSIMYFLRLLNVCYQKVFK